MIWISAVLGVVLVWLWGAEVEMRKHKRDHEVQAQINGAMTEALVKCAALSIESANRLMKLEEQDETDEVVA